MENDYKGLVFISYAKEDSSIAERLYMDLRKKEINAWMDVKCLAAGANWKYEIRRAIRDSSYFLLLLSKHSVTKRGFVQQEMKEAIDVLKQIPKNQIFLIPVKLDNTEPVDEELLDLNWVDLISNYHQGFAKILSALAGAKNSPLVVKRAGEGSAVTLPLTITDKGRDIEVEVPLIIGTRAAVSYAPFRSRNEFLRQFFDRLPSDAIFADRSFSYYITVATDRDNVLIGDDLKRAYPEFITIVMQNAYRELKVRENGVSVILRFGGAERTIGIPFDAICSIKIRELGISIALDPPAEDQ